MNKYLFSALVIDDNFEEIKNFMKILNNNGIATYYLNFVEDEIENYSKNISNIRLIVTDLLNDKTPNKLDEIIATFGFLQENKINNFLLIVWTKHQEKYKEFIEKLNKYHSQLNFIPISLNKEDFISLNKDSPKFIKDKYQELSQKVKSHIENNLFKHFLKWEASIEKKTYKILNELIENIKNDDLKILIATLTQEEKNNELKEKELFKILNTILSDEINSINIESINEDFNNIQSNETLKSKLNTAILFEKNPPNKISNGNIYLYEDLLSTNDNIKELNCGYKTKLQDFEYHKKTCKEILNIDVKKDTNREDCKNLLCNKLIKIAIDITPSCDLNRMQKHINNRLIFGYFIPSNLTKLIKKAEYIIKYNFSFEYDNEDFSIVLFCNRFFTINPKYLQKITPILRARKELTADIQQKIASHIARVGVFSLEEKK